MTEQTEQETLKADIGPRGETRVTSSNRGQVRRYLVARGLPSPFVRSLTLGDLGRLYNDESELRRALYAPADDTPEPEQTTTSTETPPANGTDPAGKLAAALAELVASGSAPVDAETVREIVRAELDARPARKLEITGPDGAARKIEGAHPALEQVAAMVGAGLNVWLNGPAGSGKTTLAEQTAEALGLEFYAVGAVTSDFRLVGYTDAKGETVRTPFREAFEHGGLFLFDEIDASNPNALVALNQALANGRYPFPDGMVEKHPDFRAVGAANTIGQGATSEYVGRTRIDAATLDRFAFVRVDYSAEVEDSMAGRFPEWAQTVRKAREAAEQHGIRHIISPRAVDQGARLLAAGLDRDAVLASTVRKGLDADSWDKIAAAL